MSTPLDQPLRAFTGYRLRRSTSALMPGVNRVLARFGLRRVTFSALAVISAHAGLKQGQLADALAIERPNLVQIVDELERNGLIRREKSPDDRRAYALRATKAGEALQREAMAALRRFEVGLVKGLSAAQIEALHCAFEIIEANAMTMGETDDIEVSST